MLRSHQPLTKICTTAPVSRIVTLSDFGKSCHSTQQAIIGSSFAQHGQTNLRAVVSEFPWDAGSRIHLQNAYEYGGKSYHCSNEPNQNAYEYGEKNYYCSKNMSYQTMCTEGSGAGSSVSKTGVMTVLFSSIVFLALWLTQ